MLLGDRDGVHVSDERVIVIESEKRFHLVWCQRGSRAIGGPIADECRGVVHRRSICVCSRPSDSHPTINGEHKNTKPGFL